MILWMEGIARKNGEGGLGGNAELQETWPKEPQGDTEPGARQGTPQPLQAKVLPGASRDIELNLLYF